MSGTGCVEPSPPPLSTLPLPPLDTVHDRVNAPFVAVAFAVPEGRDLSAFAVGVEMLNLRMRAKRAPPVELHKHLP